MLKQLFSKIRAAGLFAGSRYIPSLFSFASFMLILLAATVSGKENIFETKEPVVITASTLTADNKANTAVFEGSVIAKADDMTIYSDRMTAYYSDAGTITKIEAEGHVKVLKGEKVITADAAAYLAADNKVIFSGQPKALQSGNMISGTRMIYLIKEDRFFVENSKIFIERGTQKIR